MCRRCNQIGPDEESSALQGETATTSLYFRHRLGCAFPDLIFIGSN
jgi:hypothetical protein